MAGEFIVTRQWLLAHRARLGSGVRGWNAQQIAALGLDWPPRPGFIREVVGTVLAPPAVAEFERWSPQGQRDQVISQRLEYCVGRLVDHADVLSADQRDRLITALEAAYEPATITHG